MTAKKPPRVLYHWSPIFNRASIEKEGLRPGSVANLAEWVAPYVCYGDSPLRALNLVLINDTPLDLWCVETAGFKFRQANPHHGTRDFQEWRSPDAVPAYWIAMRGKK
jgi:hypothetical protein